MPDAPVDDLARADAGIDRVQAFGRFLALVRHLCLQAAQRLEADGISAEVLDLRALKPLDRESIRKSVEKTHRVLVAEEDEAPVGVGAEIMAVITEDCFYALDAQPVRIHAADVPVPYNAKLEKAAIPSADDVYHGALKVVGKI